MVRFFGKTRTTRSKEAAAPANGAKSEVGAKSSPPPARTPAPPPARTPAPPPARTASKTTTSRAPAAPAPATPAADGEPAKKAVRRRTTARPPRRDWAAEAAAAPIDEPAPKPSSLATAPTTTETADAAAPAKRRRGTRGGRGRKKPGTATAATAVTTTTEPAPPAILEIARPGEPVSIEAVVAHQAAVLEAFAKDVSSALKSLQTTIAGLESRVDHGAGSATGTSTAAPRVGIFVDVPNLIYAAERRNLNIDFRRVLDYFTSGRQLVRATAYAPISDDPQAKLESQRFVHQFIGLPYRLVTKPLKRFADGSMKANFDIELAIDILTMSDRLDVVVLMSGDGDFRRVVELVASRGVRVEVVAFAEAASSELKAVADLYVDIGSHLDDFKVQK